LTRVDASNFVGSTRVENFTNL